jgi:hypothetical protein
MPVEVGDVLGSVVVEGVPAGDEFAHPASSRAAASEAGIRATRAFRDIRPTIR